MGSTQFGRYVVGTEEPPEKILNRMVRSYCMCSSSDRPAFQASGHQKAQIPGLGNDRQNIILAHNQQRFTIDRYLCSRILGVENPVTFRYLVLGARAILI